MLNIFSKKRMIRHQEAQSIQLQAYRLKHKASHRKVCWRQLQKRRFFILRARLLPALVPFACLEKQRVLVMFCFLSLLKPHVDVTYNCQDFSSLFWPSDWPSVPGWKKAEALALNNSAPTVSSITNLESWQTLLIQNHPKSVRYFSSHESDLILGLISICKLFQFSCLHHGLSLDAWKKFQTSVPSSRSTF